MHCALCSHIGSLCVCVWVGGGISTVKKDADGNDDHQGHTNFVWDADLYAAGALQNVKSGAAAPSPHPRPHPHPGPVSAACPLLPDGDAVTPPSLCWGMEHPVDPASWS